MRCQQEASGEPATTARCTAVQNLGLVSRLWACLPLAARTAWAEDTAHPRTLAVMCHGTYTAVLPVIALMYLSNLMQLPVSMRIASFTCASIKLAICAAFQVGILLWGPRFGEKKKSVLITMLALYVVMTVYLLVTRLIGLVKYLPFDGNRLAFLALATLHFHMLFVAAIAGTCQQSSVCACSA